MDKTPGISNSWLEFTKKFGPIFMFGIICWIWVIGTAWLAWKLLSWIWS